MKTRVAIKVLKNYLSHERYLKGYSYKHSTFLAACRVYRRIYSKGVIRETQTTASTADDR